MRGMVAASQNLVDADDQLLLASRALRRAGGAKAAFQQLTARLCDPINQDSGALPNQDEW